MNNRYAITFGEVSILHVGGKEYGEKRDVGFSCNELKEINKKFPQNSEYISISDKLPSEKRLGNEAGILIFRSKEKNDEDFCFPLSKKLSDNLYNEQEKIEYDNKYWDNRRGKTLNKRARLNIIFGPDEQTHSEDYRIPSIISFDSLEYLNKVKKNLINILGEKSKNLKAEGNKYFHTKSGIGFHGDAERKIVICLSLGKSSKLRFNWRLPGSSEHTLEPTDIVLNHGDSYIMSEKATGFDWKSRSRIRVVHAAGHGSYINK